CNQEDQKEKEGQSLQRQPASPVWNRCQQKSCNHGRHVAKEHFMRVPVARRKQRGKGNFALEERQPQRHGECRLTCAKKEKGTEAVGKKSRASMRFKARDWAHDAGTGTTDELRRGR